MDQNIKKSYEKFLNPQELRGKLIIISLYITGFEVLKKSIIERIRGFFTNGFDETGWLIDEKYYKVVLSKNKSPLYASLLWLKDMAVIDENDMQLFEAVKEFRNRLVHEITGFLDSDIEANCAEKFGDILKLLSKIEVWWIKEVEIPTNPDLDGQDINEVMPGSIMVLRLMIEIALGAEKESSFYFNEFIKAHGDKVYV